MIKIVEKGKLKLGKGAGLKVAGTFGLASWKEAFTTAAENAGWGVQVLIDPRK